MGKTVHLTLEVFGPIGTSTREMLIARLSDTTSTAASPEKASREKTFGLTSLGWQTTEADRPAPPSVPTRPQQVAQNLASNPPVAERRAATRFEFPGKPALETAVSLPSAEPIALQSASAQQRAATGGACNLIFRKPNVPSPPSFETPGSSSCGANRTGSPHGRRRSPIPDHRRFLPSRSTRYGPELSANLRAMVLS